MAFEHIVALVALGAVRPWKYLLSAQRSRGRAQDKRTPSLSRQAGFSSLLKQPRFAVRTLLRVTYRSIDMAHAYLWFELPAGCPIQIHNREFS
jgi:hypothetical protein